MMFSPKALLATLVILLFFTRPKVHAHTGLSTPCGRYQGAAGCPSPPPGQVIDVNINAPIGTNFAQVLPLCKTSVPYPFASRTVYKAGDTIQTAYSIGSSHGGGHCQWALSYDGEKTWVVIKTEIRTCLRVAKENEPGYRVPVMLPQDAPSGNVTFMWLWYNAIGQRELYSNCADIRIEGRDGGSFKGLAPLIANYGPSNPVFPEFPTDEYPDMHELFETRVAVTIEVNGSNSPSQTGTAPASPSETCQPSRACRSIFAGSSFFWTSFIVFVSSFVVCLTTN